VTAHLRNFKISVSAACWIVSKIV